MKWNIAILIAAAAIAAAQTPGALGIGESLKQNAEELKHYSYKRRTEIQGERQIALSTRGPCAFRKREDRDDSNRNAPSPGPIRRPPWTARKDCRKEDRVEEGRDERGARAS